jgi:mannose-6-phosphate isomerase-like protein (cupin superfamily)
MMMRVERWDVRRDGAFGEAALLHKLRALGCEPSARAYPAQAIISPQTDRRPRVHAVISGLMKVTINNEAAILSAGDVVFVPADATPRIEILGPANASCFEAPMDPATP